jgi:hypothetical protein
MAQPVPANAQAMSLVVPLLVAAAVIILRNGRARRLRIERLWVGPILVGLIVGLTLFANGIPAPLALGLDLAGVALGVLIGWWRARFTHIEIDPETHELRSRASVIGMMVILGILVLRTLLRAYLAEGAGGLPVHELTDGLLAMSVGIVCAQRLEIFTRASRLLAEHRASSTP